MALGIEQNNLAPQLIASSGAALVQGIRQIGQQISGQLTEMQTKRDLGAIAQELQGVNVQSNEFPVQLAQLVSRHPLAARDERGMAMLGTLGKAHGQWQAGEAEARAFNRAMTLQNDRQRDAFVTAEAQEEWRRNRPAPPTAPKGFSAAPGLPGFVLDKDQGKILPPPPELLDKLPQPAVKGALTENQRLTQQRNARKDRLDAVQKEIDELDQNYKLHKDTYDKTFAREQAVEKEIRETKDEAQRAALEAQRSKFQTEKTVIGELADGLLRRKQERMKIYKTMESEVLAMGEDNADLPPVPAGAVAPPLGAVTPPVAGANVRRVPVLDPNGRPMQLREDQVDAAVQNGWKLR